MSICKDCLDDFGHIISTEPLHQVRCNGSISQLARFSLVVDLGQFRGLCSFISLIIILLFQCMIIDKR